MVAKMICIHLPCIYSGYDFAERQNCFSLLAPLGDLGLLEDGEDPRDILAASSMALALTTGLTALLQIRVTVG